MAILIANLRTLNTAAEFEAEYTLGSQDSGDQFLGFASQRERLTFLGSGSLEVFGVSSGDRFDLH
jgi:hypothetical protein